MLSRDLLELLICPACHGKLTEQQEALTCSGCRRIYPIEDGIPILLIARARLPENPVS